MATSKNLETVLSILKNEVDGDVAAALQKMADGYSMTWMYQGKEALFPTTGAAVKDELEAVYPIKGRVYDIRNIAEGDNLVMLEMIESYPDPDTGKVYKTPQIVVLEMQDGKILTGRHYCDPAVSHLDLSDADIERGLRGTASKVVIS